MVIWKLALSCLIAYLLGSISPSIMLGRAMGHDIKHEGSGNAGTTNTLRVLGKKAALITLVVDVLKGVIAVLIAGALAGETGAMAAALSALIGHCFPFEFHFKGGKGVAVSFGAILAVNWKIALILLLIIALTVLITRKVSLGSIVVCLAAPAVTWFLYPDFLPYVIVMALLIIFMHRSNIGRLIRGEESSLSFKKKPDQAAK